MALLRMDADLYSHLVCIQQYKTVASYRCEDGHRYTDAEREATLDILEAHNLICYLGSQTLLTTYGAYFLRWNKLPT